MSELKVKTWLGLELGQLCKENYCTPVSNQCCHVFFVFCAFCCGFSVPVYYVWGVFKTLGSFHGFERTQGHEIEIPWKLLNTPKKTWTSCSKGWESTWARGSGQSWVDPKASVLTLWTADGSSLNFLFFSLTQPLSSSQEGADSTPT